MARPKKDCIPVSARLSTSVVERLNQFCEDSGQSKTVAIERAITAYIDEYEKREAIVKKAESL